MPDDGAGLAGLPNEFAIFPLPGALLLPRGRLPMNIFEPRYLAMTSDALAAGRVFGMIQPEPHRDAVETGPAIYRVGCLGRLSSFAETDDGRFLITLTGLIRFRVIRELPPQRGYRRVQGDFTGFEGDLAVSDGALSIDRAALVGALRPYFRARGIDANWDAIEQTSDEMLVLTLCMVCPFEVPEKQALLESADGADRAAMLLALLQMGAHDRPDDEASGRRPS
jgi:uncharacterized protein